MKNIGSDFKDLFPDVQSYHLYGEMHHSTILGFLLVNALVTDGYILQMDWKDYPNNVCLILSMSGWKQTMVSKR